MPSLALADSSQIIGPLFAYLESPDESVSIGMIKRRVDKLPHQYQRELAYGIIALIERDRAEAVARFDSAIACAPPGNYTFVLSNAGVAFKVAKFYRDEMDIVRRSIAYHSVHLLRYGFFIAAKWCDIQLFDEIINKAKELSVDILQVDDREISSMMKDSCDVLSILARATKEDQISLNVAASLVCDLAEREMLNIDNTSVWVDDEGCYCYAVYLNQEDHAKYHDLDKKLDQAIIASGLDFTHVTPVLYYGE